ncbi:MAG TPA: cellulase family glycosylhydrolase [Vicinamibacteria bacterium]|nr:cellulase family glycosylhydrolase [Vicinamibacteria bacterium]
MRPKKLTFAIALLCVSVCLLALAPAALARTILKGTDDQALLTLPATERAAKTHFLAVKLHTQVLRYNVSWKTIEPKRGVYNQAYLDRLALTVHDAASQGIKVIITQYGPTPPWASDSSLWKYVPTGFKPGVVHFFYPPALSRLPDFQAFATKLASTLGSDAFGYECWNEPNLWENIYPQRIPSNSEFAVDRYAHMLVAFSKGIRAGNPDALVIAGSTAPVGRNNDLSTSPQRFATELKSKVDLSVFDAYSHHPYTTGGSRDTRPEAAPSYPDITVSLGNISTLLKIFPSKPFYITEYGYYTTYRMAFGTYVSQVTQAQYLPRAYRFAARYPQIKALVWFPYKDCGPLNPPADNGGCYSGLVQTNGVFKLSWYVFSGGNTLTLKATRLSGGSVRLAGKLDSASLGGLRGKTIVLYRHTSGHPWTVLKRLTTGSGGVYHMTLKLSRTTYFKAAWVGVTHSGTIAAR